MFQHDPSGKLFVVKSLFPEPPLCARLVGQQEGLCPAAQHLPEAGNTLGDKSLKGAWSQDSVANTPQTVGHTQCAATLTPGLLHPMPPRDSHFKIKIQELEDNTHGLLCLSEEFC